MYTEDLLRPDEVAKLLRISRATLYRRIATGQLAAYRVGERGRLRIPREAVDALLVPGSEGGPGRNEEPRRQAQRSDPRGSA
jgi:excisionase family DNA binding protein